MKNSQFIRGCKQLLERLPEEYQHWHLFGDIKELHYEMQFDDEEKFEEVCCLSMILSDREERYRIRLALKDISGNISFDTVNGFCGGLAIEDRSEFGWEGGCYVMFSLEQDNDLEIYFASGSVELLDGGAL